MAIVGNAAHQVKHQLAQLIPDSLIEQTCREEGYRFRRRRGEDQSVPVRTIHLLLLQLLARIALRGLRHVARVGQSTQAICAARLRLPVSVLFRLVEFTAKALWEQQDPDGRWKGLRVVLLDGTHVHCADTDSLTRRYGKPRNQRVGGSYPAPKLLAVLDNATGLIRRVIDLPCAKQEKTCLVRALRHLQAGDLVLGDAAFGTYANLAMLQQRGLNACIQLSRKFVVHGGRGRPGARTLTRLGKQDWLVQWKRGMRPTWMSRRAWEQLPDAITVRQIAFRLCRRGFRCKWAWIVTTLLDATAYPARDLAELYGRRWQVEVYFRDLKQSLGLAQVSARTVAGARKQMLGYVLLYNLIRRVMLQAARRQKTTPDRIGFKDTLQWLLWADPGETLPNLIINPRRRRPTQPRQVKKRRPKYDPLRADRASLARPPQEVRL